jgi:hypothetical protein
MTRSRPSLRSQTRTIVDGATAFGHGQDHWGSRFASAGFFLIVAFSMLTSSPVGAEERVSPALLAEVVGQRADQLAPIDSDEAALMLFTATVGPSLGLKDAAGALRAKRLPSKMAQELRVADLSQTVYELMAALAAWQVADAISHDANSPSTTFAVPVSSRLDWLKTRSRVESFSTLVHLLQKDQPADSSQPIAQSRNTDLLVAAHRTAYEASQRATAAWWDIYGWKERVRQAKGQARLCGTWQWIIHNHQLHGEQKTTIMFPPPGQVSANAATPAETIVLGDAIYLRWEQNGRIQEDSLLFIKDDAKIEGSFMNNTGGWGPISGKRTAGCQP